MRSLVLRVAVLGVLVGSLAASTAFAAAPAPRAQDGQTQVVKLPPQMVRGRIAKPSVVFVLGRNFRAPTSLMSEDLWRAKLARITAGGR